MPFLLVLLLQFAASQHCYFFKDREKINKTCDTSHYCPITTTTTFGRQLGIDKMHTKETEENIQNYTERKFQM